MNALKVALCFLDPNDKPIVIKPLSSNWQVDLEPDIRLTEKTYRDKIRDEVSETLSEQIKLEISPNVLREMLEEIGESNA